jgi:hypothetical protein
MKQKQKPVTVISRDQIRQLKAGAAKKPAKAYAVVMDLGELERIKVCLCFVIMKTRWGIVYDRQIFIDTSFYFH